MSTTHGFLQASCADAHGTRDVMAERLKVLSVQKAFPCADLV